MAESKLAKPVLVRSPTYYSDTFLYKVSRFSVAVRYKTTQVGNKRQLLDKFVSFSSGPNCFGPKCNLLMAKSSPTSTETRSYQTSSIWPHPIDKISSVNLRYAYFKHSDSPHQNVQPNQNDLNQRMVTL